MLPYYLLLLLLGALLPAQSQAQQSYVDNRQLNCNRNDTVTLGFRCNAPASSCPSFLTFRSSPTYNTPVAIAYLLSADASQIAAANNISDVDPLPDDTLVIVPVNCSCSLRRTYYQHNASYVLKHSGETYFEVANNTYQALSTCQSLIAQNPYNFRNLLPGMRLNVPLRCACPTPNQTAAGFNYLLTYLVRAGDTISSIAAYFSGAGADVGATLVANNLTATHFIFFFTPVLVPLRSQPTIENIATSPPPSPTPPPPPATGTGAGSTSRRWPLFVGVGIGAGFLLLLISIFMVLFLRHRTHKKPPSPSSPPKLAEGAQQPPPQSSSWSSSLMSSKGIRSAIETLSVYNFSELEKATESFAESNRIKGGSWSSSSSAYRGTFNGDIAVVKIMKGDVSREINALRKINHFHIVRLSGFCLHQGITYLVYEYAENGSLGEWLRGHNDGKKHSDSRRLDWKQRVQVAYDVADALNYLHNFTNPPYVHKNLKSSNVLLDGTMRAKITDFGLSRTLDLDDETAVMTRHVVGTHGYMAPEYVESGLITPKLDVFALGVVMLELLSGRDPVIASDEKESNDQSLLSESVVRVLVGDNVRENLRAFMDPCLGEDYPLEMAYTMAELARSCVARDLNARPLVSEVFMALSKLLSFSLDWDPSHETSVSLSD